MREIGPQVGLAAAPVDERARQIEAGVVGESMSASIEAKGDCGAPARPRGGGKVEQPARVRIDRRRP